MKIPRSSRFNRRCLIIPALAFIATVSGEAAVLSGVSATSDMGASYGTSLALTLDGSGLSKIGSPSIHDPTNAENSWISNDGDLTGEIFFDLGGIQAINGFSFWNQNDGGPEKFGVNGIQGVSISSSSDGITYTPIVGAPTVFDQEMGEFSSAQQFSFATVNASFIMFSVESNYGDKTNTGFAEIQFNTASVPDTGSSVALLGISMLGLGGLRRWIAS